MKNVSAAVIIENDKVLLTRRAPGEKLSGYWEFPGGKQETSETIQECLVREIKEELDIDIKCSDMLLESVYEYPGGKINLIAIMAQIISGNIKLTVHDDYQWVKVENLLKYQLAPADIPIAKWIIQERLVQVI